jgi:hypothetical protein
MVERGNSRRARGALHVLQAGPGAGKFADFPYSRFVDGTYRFFGSAVSMPMTPEFFDIGKKIDDMDRNGLDVAVLSLSIRGPDRVGLAKIVNDELAEIVAQRPKRFLGYATFVWKDRWLFSGAGSMFFATQVSWTPALLEYQRQAAGLSRISSLICAA